MYFTCIKTPIGLLKIEFDSFFSVQKIYKVNKYENTRIPDTALKFVEQIDLYFKGKLINFNYPLNIKHLSEFDKKVMELINQIPYGYTTTYKWIAKQLNTSPRAVGQALKRNPLPIIIPCHRVINSDGTSGGYNLGIEEKKWLIKHEQTILYKPLSHKV